MFSIDQNCHTLWDVLPKLQALRRRGHVVRHFVEDTDVAFTALGSSGDSANLRVARERFHRSGGADWGAALFYSQFLGRQAIDIRHWEPFTGMKTNVLGRKLTRSVDDLYDEFSPSDNWQLIGPSYVGDCQHHRTIGDLSVPQCAEFLRQILAKAKADSLAAFPEKPSQKRTHQWFAREEKLLESLLDRFTQGRLVELYQGWLRQYLGETVAVDLSSNLFAIGADPAREGILGLFVRDYQAATTLYNDAITETSSPLRLLKTRDGELPFFAAFDYKGHAVRTGVFLRDNELHVAETTFKLPADRSLPVDAMADRGIKALVAKAILLVIQVRSGPGGESLALPYRGSLYTPAAAVLARKLTDAAVLNGELKGIYRVRFALLDRMKSLETIIRLPEYLSDCFGADEIPASRLGENYEALSAAAAKRLEAFKDPAGRVKWQEENLASLFAKAEGLDARRRDLARTDPKSQEIRAVWRQSKAVQIEILDRTLRRIAADYQLAQIDYWDSRGAILPWSIALGGEGFYNDLISRAEIYEEPAGQDAPVR